VADTPTEFDIIFRDGLTATYYYARIARGVEGNYKQRFVRAEIQQQLLNQSDVVAQKSRPDSNSTYQTSWAAGARWWKPLISGQETDSYFQSSHMDTWSEPGKVVPTNQVVDAANTILNDNCVIAVGANGAVYAIGQTDTTNAGLFDVYLWTPASNAFVRDTGQNSGTTTGDDPVAMVYDPSDGYFYIINTDPEIVRFNPTTDVEDLAWIATGFTTYLGANIFVHSQGVMFYSGDQVYSINKSAPSATSVFNDGMGPDFLTDITFAGTAPLIRKNLKLAINTPEGIYYVKNTRQGGQPVAYVFRVDRDSAGNFIGNPMATLPAGSVALSIAYHLGSVVISTSPDWQTIVKNDGTEAEIVLYHITQGQMGALGSPLGGRSALDETPYALLGGQGSLLYLGGQKRLWIWDAVRGGLHSAWTWGTELANGAYVSMANVLDSASVPAMIFLGRDRIARIKNDTAADPDLVTNFGDDLTHYTLESNYFDVGLPMEEKQLNKVEILFDPATGTAQAPNQLWELYISADDGAFALGASSSGAGDDATTGYALGWVSARGRIFRYRLVYQTKTAVKNALKAIMVTFNTGEMVREWELILDGSEIMNVDNQMVAPEDFVTNMETLGAIYRVLAMYDNYQVPRSLDIAQSSADQREVKIVSVEIIKDAPTESLVRMVVREDPFSTVS
jgi:hypothetical protein